LRREFIMLIASRRVKTRVLPPSDPWVSIFSPAFTP